MLEDSVIISTSMDPNNNKFGTAFVFYQDKRSTYFLTCAHVVTDLGRDDQIRLGGKKAMVIASGTASNSDLAVLGIEGLMDAEPLPLQQIGQRGRDFFALGFQQFGSNFLIRPVRGKLGDQIGLESKEEQGNRVRAWDLLITGDNPLQPGYSGAPVIDEITGSVIGIVSYRQGGNRGVAIAIETLSKIWKDMPSDLLLGSASKKTYLIPNSYSIGQNLMQLDNTVDAKKPECFVIMPFREPYNEYYQNVIKPAVEDVGYSVIRADEIYQPTAFIQTIWESILKANVVIAEMTGMNPNVLYELGLCHAINRTVIMITQNIEDVPSDLRHINNIKYSLTKSSWAQDLRKNLQKMVLNLPNISDRSPYIKPIAVPEDKFLELQSKLRILSEENRLQSGQIKGLLEQCSLFDTKIQRVDAINQTLTKTINENKYATINVLTNKDEPDIYLVPLKNSGLNIEFVKVPEGSFIYGHVGEKGEVFLPEFYISRFSITNAQYVDFLSVRGNQTEGDNFWINLLGESPADRCRIYKKGEIFCVQEGFEDYPVTYVNWYGANAFCQWAGFELPTDQQWEKAARGTDGRNYPWGNSPPNNQLTNYGTNDWPRDIAPKPVYEYKAGCSPFGCYQMVGNVWHWTSTFWSDRNVQAVRGGSFFDYRVGYRGVYRFSVQPNGPDFSQGFVVIKRWLE